MAEEDLSLEALHAACKASVLEKIPDLDGDKADAAVAAVMEALAKLDALDDKYDSKTLNIIHFNDVYNLKPLKPPRHGEVLPFGGFTRFCSVVNELKADMAHPMMLFRLA
mmetsp:Transcript_12962/g.38734  ORF Transcript_12962/g.38734 Transcript_12962/m.38734 type:complete len:110 (-) Transcript_12962:68-397(-)